MDSAANLLSRRQPVETACMVLFLSAIFLQKIGFPIAGNYIGLNALILWTALLWLFVKGVAIIDLLRSLIFTVLILAVLLSLFIAQNIKTADFCRPGAFRPPALHGKRG